MKSRPVLIIGLLALLLGGGALWLYPRAPEPGADPAQKPVTGAETPAAEAAAQTEPVPEPTPVQKPVMPEGPDMDDPMNWQLLVPVGPDGNAIPQRSGAVLPPASPATSPLRRALLKAKAERGRDMVIRVDNKAPTKGPVKLTPIGPGTHQMPPPGGGGKGKGYGAGPGGGNIAYEDLGGSVWHQDGSADIWDEKGYLHTGPVAPDGSYAGWIRDMNGKRSFFFNDGNGNETRFNEDGEAEPPPSDGSMTIEYPDGAVETIDPDGNRSIDLDGMAPPDGGGGPQGGSTSGIGEPHFMTADGTGFSTQGVGEFVLATGIAGQELQIRTAPYKESRAVSAVSGFAIRAGGVTLQILLDGSVRIDGQLAEIDSPALRYDLPEGGALGLWKDGDRLAHAVLIWPDLSTLWIDFHDGFLNFNVKWRAPEAGRLGLLGLEDGAPANDLTARDGTRADPGDAAAVLAFVDGWRLGDAESLFFYEAGQTTADFTDLAFPYDAAQQTHGDLALSLCDALSHEFTHAACLFDVAVTGNEAFAAAARAMDKQLSLLKPSSPAAVAVPGECRMPGDDLTQAGVAENDYVTVTTSGDEARLFRFETKGGIIIQTRLDTADSGAWTQGQPGYCVFDETGATMIPPTSSGTDSFFSRNDQSSIPAGSYYLRVWGEGETRLSIAQNP